MAKYIQLILISVCISGIIIGYKNDEYNNMMLWINSTIICIAQYCFIRKIED